MVLLVGVGGFIGTILRYLASLTFGAPVSTFLVNLLGSFAIGVVLGLGAESIKPATLTIICVGVLGGFTTFSAFSAETVQMLRNGQTSFAFIYIGLTLVFGLAATYLGLLSADLL